MSTRLPTRSDLEALATEAGAIALTHFHRVAAERKADRSLVTAADRAVEAHVADRVATLLPDATILGEEGTARAGKGPWRIVIDPIDGTASFVAGLATWCICVGILRGSEPVAGVVHLPAVGETYVAVDGVLWWNGSRMPPLDRVAPGDRFILVDSKVHLRHQLRYAGKVRCLGSSAYHAAVVARGAAEAALLGRAHLWDLAASGALLAAAGAGYEHLGGGPVDLEALADGRRSADEVLAGTAAAVAALRAQIGPRA